MQIKSTNVIHVNRGDLRLSWLCCAFLQWCWPYWALGLWQPEGSSAQGLEHDGEGASSIGDPGHRARTSVQPSTRLRGRGSAQARISSLARRRQADPQPARRAESCFCRQCPALNTEPAKPRPLPVGTRRHSPVHAVSAGGGCGFPLQVPGPRAPTARVAIEQSSHKPPNLSTAGHEPSAASATGASPRASLWID